MKHIVFMATDMDKSLYVLPLETNGVGVKCPTLTLVYCKGIFGAGRPSLMEYDDETDGSAPE